MKTEKLANRKFEGIRRGDLVEVILNDDARRHLDSYYWYSKDRNEEEPIKAPGRSYAGYVIKTEEHEISLAHDWDKQRNGPEHGGTKFYDDSVKEVIRLKRRNSFSDIFNALMSGFNAIGKAYGSFANNFYAGKK